MDMVTFANDYTVTETGGKKATHKLFIGSKLRYQLKKKCGYKTFTFYYPSEEKALDDLRNILAELYRNLI